MEYIEYMQRKEKKRLDFNRPTFDEPEFKIPCREITNKVEDNVLKRPSNKSSLADDEESLQDSVASKESISVQSKFNVHLRLKPIKDPLPDVYNFDIKSNLVTVTSSMMTIERQYTFTSILDDNKDQKTLYDECVRPILADPFSSQGAVFASYGVSNSGKTYTILGQENPGIVPRALAQIFSENHNQIEKYPACKLVNNQIAFLDDNKANSELMLSMDLLADAKKIRGKLANQWVAIDENHHFTQREVAEEFQQIYVWVSFLEIYNEKIIDLLKPPKSGQSKFERPLKIISNNHDPYILGLTWICVSNIHDALHLLQFGLQRANYAQTGLNPHSSRSHTIFTIQLISEIATGNMSKFEIASYKFCDLAGAERISKTSNTGDRIKEAGGINSSLLVLGRCLEAVQYNQNVGVKRKQIVPVRDSKLTMLLESSLKGFEKFVMIVNLQPNIECLDENLNVLHFGSIANKIVTRSKMPRKFTRRSSRYSHVAGSTVNNSVQLTESW
ncbi:CLUMA_CG016192, isoform A [Clunio marinus]|uniref:Kinesin-like protein n=1 Tax=Clunio marinus TaxID=568069 RepID=A0A1J1ISR4_9DIPT|nr:CLUMA_CG016192, isoform A [Clunio marinus]